MECQSYNCQICYDCQGLFINNNDIFCKKCLRQWINILDLSIDINNADLDEWIVTAKNDKYEETDTLRLRNPKTNLTFNDNELIIIYNYVSL